MTHRPLCHCKSHSSMGHNVQKPQVGSLRDLQEVLSDTSPQIVNRSSDPEQREAAHCPSELPELPELPLLQWECSNSGSSYSTMLWGSSAFTVGLESH